MDWDKNQLREYDLQYYQFNVRFINTGYTQSKIEPMFQKQPCDRFIPIRHVREAAYDQTYSAQKRTETSTNYSKILSPQSSKYLKFATTSLERSETLTDFLFKSLPKKESSLKCKQIRKAIKILDAPGIVSNFYYNSLDWSITNKIGVAISEAAYLMSEDKQVVEIERCSYIPISCIKFHEENDILLLGETTGRIEVHDSEKLKRIRQIKTHYNRVGVIQKSDHSQAFFSGSKDKLIKLNDLRIRKADVATLQQHKGQVCGLSTIKHYLASGGNDNKIYIWDLRKLKPINIVKEHKGAIKALAWCPWKSCLLASGGGNNDKKIIIWNGNRNIIQSKVETQGQIVALQWKQSTKQLISGHSQEKKGYCLVWSGKKMELKLKGHTNRLLGMKLNPSNQDQVCTISKDQTLRIWDIKTCAQSRQFENSSQQEDEFLNYSFR